MIVICTCGQKLRIKLAKVASSRCPKCHTPLLAEAERQAERNAGAMFDVCALLLNIPEARWTREQEVIAKILFHHERNTH